MPVRQVRVGAYAIAGAMAGLAGFVWVNQYQSARGDNADGAILFVLTAVVLGGVSIKGGSGRALGVLLSTLLLATIQTGMKLANVPGTNQTLVIGLLLIASIGGPQLVNLVRTAVVRLRPPHRSGVRPASARNRPQPTARHFAQQSAQPAYPFNEERTIPNDRIGLHPPAFHEHRRCHRALPLPSHPLLSACTTTAPGAASARSAHPPARAGAKLKVFMSPKFTGLAYFEVARKGGEDAGKELGLDFQYIGSDKAEATEQIATLTNAVAQKPNALVVSAIDGDAVAPALRTARAAGIKVVTYDADAAQRLPATSSSTSSPTSWPRRRCSTQPC